MCGGEGAPLVHRVRSGSAIDSLLRHGSVVTVLGGRVSVWDAEPSRSERRGSESRLTVHALSARAVFAFTAVALPLPTMTTAGSGVAIGSPAISSAGGGRSGLERGRELKVATERRRRRCAFGSKLRHVCWGGGASRPPGAIRVGCRLALASRLCCHGASLESGWTATLAAPLHMGGSAQPGRDVPQSACAYYSHAIRYIHRHRIERLLPHALESSPYVRLQSCRFQRDDKWPPL